MKRSFITLAILIALVPQLGFPQVWKDTITGVSSLLIVLLVVVPRKELTSRENRRETWFSENVPPVKEETEDHLTNYSPHEEGQK